MQGLAVLDAIGLQSIPKTAWISLGTKQRSGLNDGGGRRYNLYPILHSNRTLRQPTPDGVFWHVYNVTFSHSHCDVNRAEINRAIRARRMASPLAERLTPAALQVAISLRSC